MLRVLLADDERSIIQLIKKLISPTFPVEIIGEAEDGETACEMILRLKPDIVITDIRMPGLDGVALMERVRAEAGLQTDFILISGYRDFEYARSAIRLGALEYLLKPIKAVPLNDALRRAYEKRNNREETKKKLEWMEKQLADNERLLRRELMIRVRECVNQGGSGRMEDCHYPERFFPKGGCFAALIFKLDTEREEIEEYEKQRSLEMISERYLREIRQRCAESEQLFSGSRLYILACVKEERELDILEERMKCILKENGVAMWPFMLTIAAGKRGRDLRQTEECFLTADASLLERLREGCGGFLRTPLAWKPLEKDPLPQCPERDLESAVVSLSPEETERLVGTWMEESCRMGVAVVKIRNRARQVMRFLIERLKDVCQVAVKKELDAQLAEAFQHMDDKYTLEDFCRFCSGFCRRQTEAALQRQTEGVGRQVRLMQDYLQGHYREDINLERIAEITGFTAAYASTVFRKETGMTLTNWLINFRIEKAKELIRSTNMTISEIAWAVGYADSRYFSKLFIRTVGVKPVEYRRFYSE